MKDNKRKEQICKEELRERIERINEVIIRIRQDPIVMQDLRAISKLAC